MLERDRGKQLNSVPATYQEKVFDLMKPAVMIICL